MLGDSTVRATVAVNDIELAKQFYGETLGLAQASENPGGVMYKSSDGEIFVYQSPAAGTGQATCATWSVSNIEAVVATLASKGVTFEHYEMPGATLEGDVHIMGDMKAAWLKDPDGNILGLAN